MDLYMADTAYRTSRSDDVPAMLGNTPIGLT